MHDRDMRQGLGKFPSATTFTPCNHDFRGFIHFISLFNDCFSLIEQVGLFGDINTIRTGTKFTILELDENSKAGWP